MFFAVYLFLHMKILSESISDSNIIGITGLPLQLTQMYLSTKISVMVSFCEYYVADGFRESCLYCKDPWIW